MCKQQIPEKGQRWLTHKDALPQDGGSGMTRRILAYTDGLMCVENTFETGAVGAMHSHPHTQITYVAEGEFAFTIDGETRIVRKGDAMVKENGAEHGCTCLKAGILLEIFHPMRKDFL
ncbi:MAG TPA: cupin domain-containing protein [Candidatus Faecousia intestinigallinarum]|nr:cupin domain-containing protein [Candidatus Faecousia intestinigallinarum]